MGTSHSSESSSLPLRRPSDEELMQLVARDDPLAFALLYTRHVRAAFTLALHICSRHAVAEEVVQEAFLSVWRSRRRFDGERGSVRAWLLWIVRNRAIDVLRRGVVEEAPQAHDATFEEQLPAHDRTDVEVGRREHKREVLAALDELPREQSSVIALAYYGGYTQSEIASMLDTPIGTIKGRMRLGLRKMAQSFQAAA